MTVRSRPTGCGAYHGSHLDRTGHRSELPETLIDLAQLLVVRQDQHLAVIENEPNRGARHLRECPKPSIRVMTDCSVEYLVFAGILWTPLRAARSRYAAWTCSSPTSGDSSSTSNGIATRTRTDPLHRETSPGEIRRDCHR